MNFFSLPKRLSFLLLFIFGLNSNFAISQPSGARGDDFIYKTIQNDTLIDVSARFTGNSSNWSKLQQINNIQDQYKLPIGFELRIPFDLIPEQPAKADLIHLVGSVKLNESSAIQGMEVIENDTITTSNNGFVTLQLPDNSLSAVPSDSTVLVKRMRTFLNTGLVDVILQLESGEVESTVAPDNKGVGRYEIRTPISITGVRGTQLRVRATQGSSQSEVISGQAQIGLNSTDGPRIRSNQGTVVSSNGLISPVMKLPAAPALHTESVTSGTNTIGFDPVPEATAYRVIVSADEQGRRPVSSQIITTSPAKFSAPGAGTWYLLVRTIDKHGLMSSDSTYQFEGRNILVSGFGLPVHNGFNQPILLSY